MVEISGGGAAARLADRYEGRAPFDPGRPFDYLLHSFKGSGPEPAKKGSCVALAKQRLALIAERAEAPDHRDGVLRRQGLHRRAGRTRSSAASTSRC